MAAPRRQEAIGGVAEPHLIDHLQERVAQLLRDFCYPIADLARTYCALLF